MKSTGQRRVGLGLVLIVVILLGLGSRRFSANLPRFVATYAGDTLWATAAFLGLGVLWPELSSRRIALMAMTVSVAVEISQLCKAPWLETLRRTRLGSLLLGFDFVASDLACYTLGVGLGLILDLGIRRNRPVSPDSPRSP